MPSLARLAELARSPTARRQVAINRGRALFFRLARHFTPALAVDTPEGRYFLATRDPFIGRNTFLYGAFEEASLRDGLGTIRQHIDGFNLAGRTVLDVGANIGTQTVPFLTAHGAGRVVAIEPDLENATLLRQNVIANDLQDRVTVLELAATDQDGTVDLERSAVNPGDHRVRPAAAATPAMMGETECAVSRVRAARLDALIEEGTVDAHAVALLWIDTQGHEGQVLAGATQLLGHVPIVTEYWPYGLRRAGGLDLFHSLVAKHYGQIVDLQTAYGDLPTRALPATDIASLANRYVGDNDSRTAVTDLVLLPR